MVLEQQSDVLEVQIYGTLLHIFVEDVAVTWPRLLAILNDNGVTIDNMRVIHPRMEEAFISLIRGRKEA